MVEVVKKVASELELLLMMRIGEPCNRVPNEKMDDFIKSSDSSSQLAVGRFIRWLLLLGFGAFSVTLSIVTGAITISYFI